MSFLKLFTTRNPFSREYGTWLIVLFNLIFVPVVYQKLTLSVAVFIFSILFFLLFRFELLDYFSIKIQYSQREKITRSAIYLFLSGGLYLYLIITGELNWLPALLVGFTGVLMLVLNIKTRRQKGQRQPIFAQLTLIVFMAFIGALNYYLMFKVINNQMFSVFICQALFYATSVIYVRSKTVGAPYHIYATGGAVLGIVLVFVFSQLGFVNSLLIITLVPTLVKNLDNILLLNTKVPLRRVGLSETFHSLLFITLYAVLVHL